MVAVLKDRPRREKRDAPPISVKLTESQRADLERLARAHRRSISEMAWVYIMRCMYGDIHDSILGMDDD